jgi:hypothetical protein
MERHGMFADETYRRCPLIIKMYFLSRKMLHRFFQKLYGIATMCFTGFWLGLLNSHYLCLIDEVYYNNSSMYYKDDYNKKGLWNWEKVIIDKYFYDCKDLMILGAGGGREYLELYKMGYHLDGFECNPKLVEYANSFLEKEGIMSKIQISSRDNYQYRTKRYDGIIIGWGTYMLIQGHEHRVALLKTMRNHLLKNSPILLSFFCRSDAERRFKVAVKIGNTIRWILRRDFLDTGDYLYPNYVHFFSKEEIASEMRTAGFELTSYSTDPYGHAVGLARQ